MIWRLICYRRFWNWRIEDMSDSNKTICVLVVGHKKSSPGAMNENFQVTEFEFNERLAERIQGVSTCDLEVVHRDTYRLLPERVNLFHPKFVISLHCNAFNTYTLGCEMLHYRGSVKGKQIAEILQQKVVEALGNFDRGVKAKTSEDRGGYFLRYVNAPAVIAESFFIDNDGDFRNAEENLDSLVQAYVQAIDEISIIFGGSE